MRKRWALGFFFAVSWIGFLASDSAAQTQLQDSRQIKLPVPSSLGAFGWEEPAKEHVAVAVAPDQSVLVLDPDADGNWLLVRVRDWWTEAPRTEVLPLPGLKGGGGTACCSVNVELQVTPDGRHAVAFASMVWLAPLFKHKNYVPKPPNTIITVVDLEHWTVATSIHALAPQDMEVRGARILDDQWIAMQGFLPEGTTHPYAHVYERRNLLISIPELRVESVCVSAWSPDSFPGVETRSEVWNSIIDSQEKKNDEACAALLKTAHVKTTRDWESLIYKSHRAEPRNLLLQSLYSANELEEDLQQPRFPMASLQIERNLYFDRWDEPDRYDMYAISPPYQSTTHNWYALGLSFGDGSIHSSLGEFDRGGKLLKEASVPGALCDGVKSHGWNAPVCGCHIEGVSAGEHTLIAYCRTQRGDYAGTVLKEWVSIVRTDDFSNVGTVDLSKSGYDREVLVSVGGHAYLLVVSNGQMLRVYDVGRQG